MLSRAFYNDPPARWLFPNQRTRQDRLERWFRVALERLYLRHDHCYTTENLKAAALWVPPGARHLGAAEQLVLLPRVIALFRRDSFRNLRALLGDGTSRPEEPHYYLPFMGVDPGEQGRGLGARVLRPVLDRCDEERLPACLEATAERNVAFYERQCFEIRGTKQLGDGPSLWLMLRRPRAGPPVQS
jgi:GNAT superfamily N-acetyltransferase